MNLDTVVADSVVYEPSREVMPVSEVPGRFRDSVID